MVAGTTALSRQSLERCDPACPGRRGTAPRVRGIAKEIGNRQVMAEVAKAAPAMLSAKDAAPCRRLQRWAEPLGGGGRGMNVLAKEGAGFKPRQAADHISRWGYGQ